MRDATKIEFENICENILNCDKFKSLNKEMHHGITRYQHSMHVAKTTHFILKTLRNDNLKEATQAALLHDFYNDNQIEKYDKVKKLKEHPSIALKNAKESFNISLLQEDIIGNHMFPSTKKIPKSFEGKVVSLVDKGVALYEMAFYKVGMQLGVLLLFVFNLISINN